MELRSGCGGNILGMGSCLQGPRLPDIFPFPTVKSEVKLLVIKYWNKKLVSGWHLALDKVHKPRNGEKKKSHCSEIYQANCLKKQEGKAFPSLLPTQNPLLKRLNMADLQWRNICKNHLNYYRAVTPENLELRI